MNRINFCYWLQGLFEIGDVKTLTSNQIQIIKDHLALANNNKATKNQLKEIQFCNWLEGYLDFSETKILSNRQVKLIKDRLSLVYTKVTPNRNKEIHSLDNIKFDPKNTLDINNKILKQLQIENDNIDNKRYCHSGLGDLRVC